MQIKLFFLFLILALSIGCSSSDENVATLNIRKSQDFIFNMQLFLTDQDEAISFPVWFNDSIIRTNNIKKIIRITYNSAQQNPISQEKTREYVYQFDIEGRPKTLEIKSYYENVLFDHVTFNYLNVKDSIGYCMTTIEEGYDFDKPNELNNRKRNLYTRHASTNGYKIYENENGRNYQIFILDSSYWGTISVDTIFNPQSEDIITFGSPRFPKKRYQVRNTVEEFNVTTYNYNKNTGSLIEFISEEYPFLTKRSINYSYKGMCEGFVDSIFSDEKYLSRKFYVFEFDKKRLPIKLGLKRVNEHNNNAILQRETYEYEYF